MGLFPNMVRGKQVMSETSVSAPWTLTGEAWAVPQLQRAARLVGHSPYDASEL
jgi:hypothetical protein